MTRRPPQVRPHRAVGGLLITALVLLGVGCSPDRLVAGGGTRVASSRVPVVAWINQGAASEDSWTASQRRAADSVAAEFGDRVRVRFIENVDLGVAADRAIDQVVADGAKLVFGTSLALEPALVAGAERHPSVRFEQVRGTTRRPNLGTFTGAYEQTAYLSGMAAASASRTGRLGFVAQFPQAEMLRIVDGYTLGARAVRPDATVAVVWTDSWWDPGAESAAVDRLVAGGADGIATTCTSLATGMAADRWGVSWSGHDVDSSARFAGVWLTANLTRWDRYYLGRVRSLLDGRWRSDDYYGDLSDGFLTLAPFGQRVEPQAMDRIEAARRRLSEGALDVFAGPVRDDTGVQRVRPGTTLDLDARLHLDWMVDGARMLDQGQVPPAGAMTGRSG